MQKISAKKLCEIVSSASCVTDVEIDNIVSDSRMVKEGDLFVAIKGEKNDGHNYVTDVLQKGASLALVDHVIEGAPAER